jgi:hypothetical protein
MTALGSLLNGESCRISRLLARENRLRKDA